jgi:hypothetical protein
MVGSVGLDVEGTRLLSHLFFLIPKATEKSTSVVMMKYVHKPSSFFLLGLRLLLLEAVSRNY